MGRRRRQPGASSLELLLDTICNTFGGILFLAILVCILLRNTSPLAATAAGTPLSAAETLQTQTRIETLLHEAESLRRALALQTSLAEQIERPGMQQTVADWERLQVQCDAAEATRAALAKEVATLDARRRQMSADQAKSSEKVQEARDRLRGLQLVLKQELAERRQETRLPYQRTTNKREIAVLVRFGRLYVWHRYDAIGQRQGLNTEEFVIVSERWDRIDTAPKPYAGIPLLIEGSHEQVALRLRHFDPRSRYLAVVVWPDSFSAFRALKASFVRLGFEYRLVPAVPGEPISDRGGSNSRVQ